VLRFGLRLLVTALALVLFAFVFPSLIEVDAFASALLFALLVGLLNAFLRPVILLLTLPLTIIPLGLFTLVVNALLFWLASIFSVGVAVRGFAGAFLAALAVSVVSFVASRMLE
jgi:putative membrane protein